MRIQVCGRLAVSLDGVRVEDELPGRKGRLLVGYLVVNRARDVGVDELLTALWGSDPPSLSTLRALVSKTRQVLGQGALGRGGPYRLVLPAGARVDIEAAAEAVHRAESSAAAGEWTRAWGPAQVALFTAQRGFLTGEESLEWIEDRRRWLAEMELRALECYGAASLGIGGRETAGAERVGRTLVQREPYRESGYRLLMSALAARGNVADAVLVYERLRERLREDLGIGPGADTRALHQELLNQS